MLLKSTSGNIVRSTIHTSTQCVKWRRHVTAELKCFRDAGERHTAAARHPSVELMHHSGDGQRAETGSKQMEFSEESSTWLWERTRTAESRDEIENYRKLSRPGADILCGHPPSYWTAHTYLERQLNVHVYVAYLSAGSMRDMLFWRPVTLNFNLLRWKLAHRLHMPRRTFTSILVFRRLFVFALGAVRRDGRTDGQDL